MSGADNDPESSSSAMYDHSDDSEFGAGPSAPNKSGRKKAKAHVFGLHGTCICSCRGSKERPQSSFDIVLVAHTERTYKLD